MKVVINRCYGGFSISPLYKPLFPELEADDHGWNLSRTDSRLIEAIEKYGSDEVSGSAADLRVIEIPDGIAYEISDYDGLEEIHEVHRVWR